MDTQSTMIPAAQAGINLKDFDLSAHTLLVRLKITKWTARKTDKKATHDLAQQNGTEEDRISVRKSLVAKETLKNIDQIANEARTEHYASTAPYLWEGPALLPAADSWRYQQEMNNYKLRFERAVDEFMLDYPALRANASAELNGLYNPEDYPEPDVVRSKFQFNNTVDLVPNTDHVMLNVSQENVRQIVERVQTQQEEAARIVMQTAYDRMREAVSRIVETLPKFNPTKKGKERGAFRDSLITNVLEICERLKALNIAQDPALEQIRQDCKDLLVVNPDHLREEKYTRDRVTQDAQQILDRINQYAGIYGPAPEEG